MRLILKNMQRLKYIKIKKAKEIKNISLALINSFKYKKVQIKIYLLRRAKSTKINLSGLCLDSVY